MCKNYIIGLNYAKSCLSAARRYSFFSLWIDRGFVVDSHKFSTMEQEKKNTGLYWLLFFVSSAGLIVAIASHFSYLTLILPFVFTSFVKAMDIM